MLEPATHQSHSNKAGDRLLSALQFFATGGFYRSEGDAHGPSEATICRDVRTVVAAINQRLFDEITSWPESIEDQLRIAQDFYALGQCPLEFVDVLMALQSK